MRDARRLQRPPPTTPGRLRHRRCRAPTRCCGPRTGPTSRPTAPWPWPRRWAGRRARWPRRSWRRPSLDDVCAEVEVSGPGFINLTLSDAFVAEPGGGAVGRPAAGRRAGGAPRDGRHRLLGAQRGQGDARRPPAHARSSATRWPASSASSGHDVRRENHIGDWGTPFGMLIEHLLDVDGSDERRVLQRARPQRVLRAGPPAVRQRPRLRRALPAPRRAAPERRRRDAAPVAHLRRRERCATPREVYDLLGVLLTDEDIVGESFYNPLLPVVVVRARREGSAGGGRRRPLRVPRGLREPQRRAAPAHRAQVRRRVRLPGHRPGRRPRPHRPPRRHPARSTSSAAEQSLHLRLVFAVAAPGRLPARRASRPSTSAFGLVLGTDGKKMASRGRRVRAADRPAVGGRRAGRGRA